MLGDAFGALVGRPHPEPGLHCGCGVAGRDASWVPVDDPIRVENGVQAFAAVALWGTLRVSRDRVRAEHGRIEAVALAPRQPRSDAPHVREFAAPARIPVVDPEDLPELGFSSGPAPIADLLAAVPEPRLVEITGDPDQQTPHFRFAFGPTGGRVLHSPYGVTPQFAAGEPAAVGDITALDCDRAIASFAYVLPAARDRALAELRRWAAADDWRLTIQTEPRPLAPLPAHEYPASRSIRCTHCGHTTWVSAVVGPHWVQQPFHRTRCRDCGLGRRFPSNVTLSIV